MQGNDPLFVDSPAIPKIFVGGVLNLAVDLWSLALSPSIPMTSEENIHSESNNTWTLVTRRRRRAISALSYMPQATYSSSRVRTPSPWTPTDSSADPERESKLLRRMQSSIRRLEKSRFFRRFLCRMRSPLIQECLDKLLVSCSRIQIVAYGIGSIESYEVPRLQLALAILLMQELGARVAGSIEVFDPILSSVECAVVAALGCTVVSVDEGGRREATVPTLFYMPHCELVLYDSLLEANWKPVMLKRLVVLGNSFGVYERYANERVGAGSVSLEVQGRHVLGSRRYVREVEMEDTEYFPKENDEEDFFEAFHDMSWHFFDLQDDAKL